MTRITRLFQELKRQHRCGMIAYLTAGDPTPEATPHLIEALERGGADLIELGVPFSDPIADGPVIQQAGDRALAAGTTLAKVLDIAVKVRQRSEIPLLLFTYLNPVVRYGFEKLARDAKAAGIDGCLLTDASVEEAGEYVKVMREAGLDTVFLAAPTSTERRLKLVAEYSSGFVYLVSRTGITGEQQTIAEQPPRLGQCLGNPRCREGQLDRFQAAGVERLGDPDRLLAIAGANDRDRLGRAHALERIRR